MTELVPLTELVALDAAVQALLLLAVEPRLGGVVFAAPAGTGKSSLARGFANLGAGIQNSEFRIQNNSPTLQRREPAQGTCLVPSPRPLAPPFIELPPAADEEALLGGIDLEATLRTGRRAARSGLLARAHGGTLYADQINLLSDGAANLLLGAIDAGEVKIEREGLSLCAPARFNLIGSYDPAEGQPRRHLLDRVGVWVNLPAQTDAAVRRQVVRVNLGEDGRQTTDDGQTDLAILQGLVSSARQSLAEVAISDEQIGQLAATALAFGVEGHRADSFAVYAACAAAALALRDTVEQTDLELAVRLTILPRATRIPEQESQNQEPQNGGQGAGDRGQELEDSEQEPQNQESQNQPQAETTDDGQPTTDNQQLPEAQVLTALMTELPAELEALPFKSLRRGKIGSRGSVAGTRGRHIRSSAGDLRRGKIDISATLRAAAPWQVLRGQGSGVRGQGAGIQNSESRIQESGIWNAGAMLPSGSHTTPTARHLALRADDVRVKQFKAKAGALFLFAVDASGSMALHRMRQAKGAVHALLQRAYVHRDRVALLAFRGETAKLLLPPSQSVELARRALDLLPTGGGTPIAAALLAALDVAKQARGRGILQTVLVLLTDGRANIGLRTGRESQASGVRGQGSGAGTGSKSAIVAELQLLGHQVTEAGIHALVIDTQRSYLSRGEARKLADYLGGKYIYLPNANSEAIANAAAGGVIR